MAFTDFLTEGAAIPAGSAVKSLTSQTVLPDWYTNYAMDILAGQTAASARPYSTYEAPRIAGFNPTQQQGFDATRAAAGAYQYPLMRAQQAVQGTIGKSTLDVANPFFKGALSFSPSSAAAGDYGAARGALNNASGFSSTGAAQPLYAGALSINPSDVANPNYTAAEGMAGSSLGANGAAAAQPYYSSAAGMSGLGAAQPYFGAGTSMIGASVNPLGYNAASPYLGQAAGTVENVDSYMNPYIDRVVDRIGELGQRNLLDNIMPALEGRYISSGQWQGSGQMTDTMRAVRDTANDILGQQGQALYQGYVNAQGMKGSDLGRILNVGQTFGSLGQNQQNIMASAGRNIADIGSSAGALTRGQQDVLSNIGTNLGSLTAGQQRAMLDASRLIGDIGTNRAGLAKDQQSLMADIGTKMGDFAGADRTGALNTATGYQNLGAAQGALAQDERDFLANMGQTSANLAGGDYARDLGAAGQMASLAGLAQQYGLTGAGAITAVGDKEQALEQTNLDLAYQDYLKQMGYPQAQIDAMLNTFKGVAGGVPTGSQEYGIVPSGQQAQYKPSTASQIAAGAAGLGGLIDAVANL